MPSKLNFSAQVDAWVKQTEQRMTAVFRESTQRTVSYAQARIPIDTGFARASVRVSFEAMPTIDSASKPAAGQAYGYTGSEVSAVIANARLGQNIYVGWTAAYVEYLENGHSKQAPTGFVGLAVQRWDITVKEVTEDAKRRAA